MKNSWKGFASRAHSELVRENVNTYLVKNPNFGPISQKLFYHEIFT